MGAVNLKIHCLLHTAGFSSSTSMNISNSQSRFSRALFILFIF